jgi:uncharacterized protein YbaR (Trm112 family)
MNNDHSADMSDEAEPAERRASRRASPDLLEVLVCPVTHAILRYDADAQELISDRARLAYPIRDGIPIMLVEEARSTDD